MKKLLPFILATLLSACVVTPVGVGVAYEPDVVVGDYVVGSYYPGYGYWTGFGWDADFYREGHRGFGHYYRNAPDYARDHFHGSRGVHGGHNGRR